MRNNFSTKIIGLCIVLCITAGCNGLRPIDKRKTLGELKGPDVMGVKQGLEDNATASARRGDFASASQYYKELISKEPTNDRYKIAFADNLRKSGAAKNAVLVYDDVLNRKPSNVDALEGKALALLSSGDTFAAGQLFNQVLALDALRWKSVNGAGIVFATEKRYSEADEYFDLALEIEPYNPTVLNNKGLNLAITGNYFDAKQFLANASKYATNNINKKRQIDLNLALVSGISGDTEKAEGLSRKYLSEPQVFNNMGIYASLSKDKRLAEAYLNKALSGSAGYYKKAWDNLDKI